MTESNTSNNQNKFQVKFASDEPTEQDKFGLHQNTAQAICDIIHDNKDNSIRAIGLFGEWGSGKSSVIEMAKKCKEKSSKQCNYKFFIYDAWCHQGDSPKTSFLLNLIDNTEKDINTFTKIKESNTKKTIEDEYKEIKQKLENKTEIHETESKPVFSIWHVLLAISILFIPFSVKLYDTGCDKSWSDNPLSTFLIMLPVLVIFINYLCWRPYKEILFPFSKQVLCFEVLFFLFFIFLLVVNNGVDFILALMFIALCLVALPPSFFTTNNEKHKKDWHIAGLPNHAITTTINKISKSNEVSSFDFSNYLTKIVDDYNNANMTLVIVIDNLDRVNANIARDIWSAVWGIIAKNCNSQCDKKPFIIIPIAEIRLQEILELDKGMHSSHLEGLHEKIFDVILRITPPIRSDWEEYFKAKLQECLPESIDEQRIYFIIKILRKRNVCSEKDNEKTSSNDEFKHYTPRNINSIINEVVALYYQRKSEIVQNDENLTEDISLKEQWFILMFYYILCKKEVQEAVIDIRFENIGLDPMFSEKETCQRILVSLHYGVTYETAWQVFTDKQLDEIILRGAKKDVSKLRNMSWFLGYLKEYVNKNQIEENAVSLLVVIHLLRNSKNSATIEYNTTNDICPYDEFMEDLETSLKTVTSWRNNTGTDEQVCIDTLGLLIRKSSEPPAHLFAVARLNGLDIWLKILAGIIDDIKEKEWLDNDDILIVPGDESNFVKAYYLILVERNSELQKLEPILRKLKLDHGVLRNVYACLIVQITRRVDDDIKDSYNYEDDIKILEHMKEFSLLAFDLTEFINVLFSEVWGNVSRGADEELDATYSLLQIALYSILSSSKIYKIDQIQVYMDVFEPMDLAYLTGYNALFVSFYFIAKPNKSVPSDDALLSRFLYLPELNETNALERNKMRDAISSSTRRLLEKLSPEGKKELKTRLRDENDDYNYIRAILESEF